MALRPIHIIEHDDKKTTECGPNIQDPFSPKKNLGSGNGLSERAIFPGSEDSNFCPIAAIYVKINMYKHIYMQVHT